MRITDTRDKSTTQYLLDTPLKDVKSFKDLGVTISKGLSWDNHISITVNKANNLLGLIKRSVGTTNESSMLYLSLVRPILEYAVPVWCPYIFENIRALESIQRRASRLAVNQHKGGMPYVHRCKLLKWLSLSDRRNYISLIECYKLIFGYYHLNFYRITLTAIELIIINSRMWVIDARELISTFNAYRKNNQCRKRNKAKTRLLAVHRLFS